MANVSDTDSEKENRECDNTEVKKKVETKKDSPKKRKEKSEKKNEKTEPKNAECEKSPAEDKDKKSETESEEEKLSALLEESKDKFLRKVAEFENFKKRTAKEKSENFALGLCEAVEKLLPVLDSLDRAIETSEANDDKEALLSGIKMVRNQFSEALGSLNVSEIDAEGKEFNPDLHNAVMTGESDLPSNTVTDVFAKGYIYESGDTKRVIRHSMVKVST